MKVLDISGIDENNGLNNCIYYTGKQHGRHRYIHLQQPTGRNHSLYELYKQEQKHQRQILKKRTTVRQDLLDTLIGRYKKGEGKQIERSGATTANEQEAQQHLKRMLMPEQASYRLMSEKVELLKVNEETGGKLRVCNKKVLCERSYLQDNRMNRKFIARTRRVDQAIRNNHIKPPNIQNGSPWGQMSVVREESIIDAGTG